SCFRRDDIPEFRALYSCFDECNSLQGGVGGDEILPEATAMSHNLQDLFHLTYSHGPVNNILLPFRRN
ncbi:hypothetical protein, partial [Akkermansia glycaniphila]|uniref:hypothetical protein n=1 Tax=Akkermansia glycaniphila TaxID=1679444 RepID=UPI001C022BCD